MFYFSRGGTRGGRDQFDWETVKGDKHKEYYLGNSLKTVRPTFNCPKPNTGWWTEKKGKTQEEKAREAQEEFAEIKRKENALMNQALGIQPKEKLQSAIKLDSTEVAYLTKRGETDHGDLDIDRVEGLGFAPSFTHEVSAPTRLEGSNPEEFPEKPKFISVEDSSRSISDKELRKRTKMERKEKKREKKEKKRRKREKRRIYDSDEDSPPRKRRRRHDSYSPSPNRHRQRHDSDDEANLRESRRDDRTHKEHRSDYYQNENRREKKRDRDPDERERIRESRNRHYERDYHRSRSSPDTRNRSSSKQSYDKY